MECATRGVAAFLLTVVLASGAVRAAEAPKASAGPRTWTDSTGKFKVKATLVDLLDDKVQLQREDGKTVEVPLERLSAEDREAAKAIFERMKSQQGKAKSEGGKNPFDAASKAEALSVQEVSRRVEKGIVYIGARAR